MTTSNPINDSSHQLAYFARQLTLRAASDSMSSMAGALLDAQVALKPHQIDAALFATSNPLSKGVILADEIGMGKTIEAGLLIARYSAERKKRDREPLPGMMVHHTLPVCMAVEYSRPRPLGGIISIDSFNGCFCQYLNQYYRLFFRRNFCRYLRCNLKNPYLHWRK